VSTLWRHISRRFLAAFAGSLVILTLAVSIVDMLLNLDDILGAKGSLLSAMKFLAMRTGANYLPYLLPVATFLGVFATIGQAARNREVLAMKAGGISPFRALVPIFLISAIIALFALILNESVTVPFRAEVSAYRYGTHGQLAIRGDLVWYHTGRFIYYTPSLESDHGVIRDFRILERGRDGRLQRFVYAATATQVSKREFTLHDAVIRRFDPNDPDAPPDVERAPEITLTLADRDLPELDHEAKALPLNALSAYVRAALNAGVNAAAACVALHARLTLPLLVPLFALLAAPFAFLVEQTKSLARPALQGVGLIALFMVSRDYGDGIAAQAGNVHAAMLVPWLTVLTFATFGAWRLTRTRR
jgi:lipopolysaccharide export system permease protein